MDVVVKLKEKELLALRDLADSQDMSLSNVMRQALRTYQTVHVHAGNGREMIFRDMKTKVIQEHEPFGCPSFDD